MGKIAAMFPKPKGGMRAGVMISFRSTEEKVWKEITSDSALDSIRWLRSPTNRLGRKLTEKEAPVVWRQYKKTFWRMQLVIGSVCAGVFLWSHLVGVTALFFVTMQLASALGGLWAERLKRKIDVPLLSPPTAR